MLIPEEDPWRVLLDSLGQFSSDFMQDREQPAQAESREEWLGDVGDEQPARVR